MLFGLQDELTSKRSTYFRSSLSVYASSNPKTTTATYDSQFHLYLKSLTNPLGQPPTTFEYYGVDGIGLDTANGMVTGLMNRPSTRTARRRCMATTGMAG